MTVALAFDMFGTLAHPFGSSEALAPYTEQPDVLAKAWRRHQLEISWLLSVMERYEDWSAVTAYALDVALAETRMVMSVDRRAELLAQGGRPKLFDDVPEALDRLASAGFEMAVFSNGTQEFLEVIVKETGIADHFVQLVSVNDVRVFKPAPAVYRYVGRRLGRDLDQMWLVSANPFDCAGAKAVGMHVAKVERGPSFTYPFVNPPDLVVGNLTQLVEQLLQA